MSPINHHDTHSLKQHTYHNDIPADKAHSCIEEHSSERRTFSDSDDQDFILMFETKHILESLDHVFEVEPQIV
jgi:hypothetical protein